MMCAMNPIVYCIFMLRGSNRVTVIVSIYVSKRAYPQDPDTKGRVSEWVEAPCKGTAAVDNLGQYSDFLFIF